MDKLTKSGRKLFDILVVAAARGDRCPTQDQLSCLGAVTTTPAQLARKGFIKVEVYTLNWRVIEIRHGQHTGLRTKECPHRGTGKPHRVIDRASDRYVNGKIISEVVEDGPDKETREKSIGSRPIGTSHKAFSIEEHRDACAMEDAISRRRT